MKVAIAYLVSDTPYSQSKPIDPEEYPAKPKETADAKERRLWRYRQHATPDGRVFIPGASFGICLKSSAKRLKLQVPGKGKLEYTKYFEAGVMVPGALELPDVAAEVPFDRLYVPSDGRRGGSKRVWKWFPRIDKWEGEVTFYIFDDMITEDVFRQVLAAAGLLVGIGRFRPENCGFYGRFSIKSLKWVDDEEALRLVAGAAA